MYVMEKRVAEARKSDYSFMTTRSLNIIRKMTSFIISVRIHYTSNLPEFQFELSRTEWKKRIEIEFCKQFGRKFKRGIQNVEA